MSRQQPTEQLPPIPSKRYFTIGEASLLCGVKPHVLRYWEQTFDQLRPTKRRGSRRYYQPEDLATIRRIRTLLYDEGYTVEGARQQLASNRQPAAAATPAVVAELQAVVGILRE